MAESREGGDRRIPIGDSLVIGRASDCGLVIDDGAASRRHVQITRRGDVFFWKDMGSTNGTVVDGSPMLEGRLKHNDVIQIGETRLRFEVEELPDQGPPDEDTTMFKETVLDLHGKPTAPMQMRSDRSEKLLRAVYSVTKAIATNYEPCSLVDNILHTSMKAIQAQRGAVFFTDADRKGLHACPVCNRYHLIEDGRQRHVHEQEIRISNTVVNRVLQQGESVLYQDTQSEKELSAAASILALDLRSIMCVPMRGKNGVIGVLYVDSNRPDHRYSHEDMLLATAVGNSAGLALENARMHQQVLEKIRTDEEIKHAWIIQEGFLIKDWPAADPRFDVYGKTQPAKTVGGDFYDYVSPNPDTIGILIGDVSGKGVPAALSMAQILAEFRLIVQRETSPATVLEVLNQGLTARSQRGMFCTLCYIKVDLKKGKAICANAGHHPPLCIGKNGTVQFGQASGPPLGILANQFWTDTVLQLERSDTIVLYTDGLVETSAPPPDSNPTAPREEFGVDRMVKAAAALYGAPPRDLIETFLCKVHAFAAPGAPHDDCTLIALRYWG